MAKLSPLTFLGPSILLSLSFPLFVFAVVTSTLASTILLLRASMVYFELGVALLRSYLSRLTHAPPKSSNLEALYRQQLAERAEQQQPGRTKQRSSAYTSFHSGARGATSVAAPPSSILSPQPSYTSHSLRAPQTPARSASRPARSASTATLDLGRDFEGIGGWRLLSGTSNDEEEREDALWMSLNSRLELPTPGPVLPSPGVSLPGPTTPGAGMGRSLSHSLAIAPIPPFSTSTSTTPGPSAGTTPRALSIPRHHTRSLTSRSQRSTTGSGAQSPEDVRARTPKTARSPERVRKLGSGSRSPERSRKPGSPAMSRTSLPAMQTQDLSHFSGAQDFSARKGSVAPDSAVDPLMPPLVPVMSPEEVVTEERMKARRRSIGSASGNSAAGGRSNSASSGGSGSAGALTLTPSAGS